MLQRSNTRKLNRAGSRADTEVTTPPSHIPEIPGTTMPYDGSTMDYTA